MKSSRNIAGNLTGAALMALALALAAPVMALVAGLCLAGVAASHGGIGPEGGAA